MGEAGAAAVITPAENPRASTAKKQGKSGMRTEVGVHARPAELAALVCTLGHACAPEEQSSRTAAVSAVRINDPCSPNPESQIRTRDSPPSTERRRNDLTDTG